MKIQIQVVTWNSEKDLSTLLSSIEQQTRKPDALLAIDNNSSDKTKQILRERGVSCIEQKKNTGFSYAHNVGIASSDADAILCINPDVRLFPHALEKLETALLADKEIGTISGILIKPPLTKAEKISIVDSAGIGRNVFFRFTNILENKPISSKYAKTRQVVANTGACVLIHKKRAESASVKKNDRYEIFDEDMFAYKEDVDLGLRIKKVGYKNIVLGEVIGEHSRHIGEELSHANRSKKQIFLSYRNHLLLLLKNVLVSEIALYGIPILIYELFKFVYLLATHPLITIRALGSTIFLAPRMIHKRLWINKKKFQS